MYALCCYINLSIPSAIVLSLQWIADCSLRWCWNKEVAILKILLPLHTLIFLTLQRSCSNIKSQSEIIYFTHFLNCSSENSSSAWLQYSNEPQVMFSLILLHLSACNHKICTLGRDYNLFPFAKPPALGESWPAFEVRFCRVTKIARSSWSSSDVKPVPNTSFMSGHNPAKGKVTLHVQILRYILLSIVSAWFAGKQRRTKRSVEIAWIRKNSHWDCNGLTKGGSV